MKRIYYFLILVGLLGVVSCSNDDSSEGFDILAAFRGALRANGQSAAAEGYESRLLAPPGYERGVGYCYATGAECETRSAVSKQLALSASVGANFIVADIKVTGNYSKGSVEESQSVFAMKRTKRVAYSRDLQYKNVIMYYKETGDSMVFAPGFYADWKKLEGNNVNQADVSNQDVLNFVNKWGRGFVARSFMGGVLEYVLQIDKSALSENMSVGMALDASVGFIIGVDMSTSVSSEHFQKVSRDRYNLDINVRGGNVQAVTAILSGDTSSPQGIKDWMDSVNFPPTPDNDQLKLCAMTDVKIASIANLFTGKVQDRVNYILRTYAQ